MSAHHRLPLRGLACCLFAIACASPALGQALDSTLRITRGTCPVAHCNLGTWQSGVAVPVFDAPGATKPSFSVKPRVPFEALRGETHAVPGVHVLRAALKVFDDRRVTSLKAGDTIRTVAYLGDGRFSVEVRGRAWLAAMDDRDGARFLTLRPRRETWWVEVKAPGGRRGWINGGNPTIAGRSFDDTMAPVSPAMLDPAFLAGLTGPVAEIAGTRDSSTITPFELPVDGARGGEGIAWWRGDRLEMVQQRFTTMLTASGTTRPEHSGLLAGDVVCCGDLVYYRLMVFTHRDPEYVATITVPSQGPRRMVEAFYENGRMVRLLRDGLVVIVEYSDSVIGRRWYSAARSVAQEMATSAPRPPSQIVAETGQSSSFFAGKRLVLMGLLAAAIAAAGVGAWEWRRRRARSANRRKSGKAALAAIAVPAEEASPAEEEGWVCPYCHADVLLDLDSCWLCGRARPTGPAGSTGPAMMMCACGEPTLRGAKSCKRCGKSFGPKLF